ncbi:MAG: hypothetical protein IT196_20075, partial [Acidimicrobiales bacterium]|nr:hypothetical protein [Acidimicrobiales bacterium]
MTGSSGWWSAPYVRAAALAAGAALVVLVLLMPQSVNPLRAESGPPPARTKLTVAPLVVSTTVVTVTPGWMARARQALVPVTTPPVVQLPVTTLPMP